MTERGKLEINGELIKVMTHPLRLEILQALRDGGRCVKDLNKLLPLSQPMVSQHMAALRKAGIVACHINGPLRCYYLLRPRLVTGLLDLLLEEHPAVERPREEVVREAGSDSDD